VLACTRSVSIDLDRGASLLIGRAGSSPRYPAPSSRGPDATKEYFIRRRSKTRQASDVPAASRATRR